MPARCRRPPSKHASARLRALGLERRPLSIYWKLLRDEPVAAEDVIRFLNAPRTPLEGAPTKEEALSIVSERYPGRPYCIVEEWTVFEIEITPEEAAKIQARGQLPLFLFSHSVVEDSEGRFDAGDFVRSSMCVAFEKGVFFETRNTVYVLQGPGHKQLATLQEVFAIT